MARSDLIACAGVPDRRETLPDGEVLEWRQDQQVQGPLSLELDLGGHGTCHFVARLQGDRVTQVEYTGSSGTMLVGPYSACRPLVLACERRITPLRRS